MLGRRILFFQDGPLHDIFNKTDLLIFPHQRSVLRISTVSENTEPQRVEGADTDFLSTGTQKNTFPHLPHSFL